jgi:HEAT repeat protein
MALCPADLRPLLLPLVEQVGMTVAVERASQRFGAPAADPIEDLLEIPDVWIRACTAYALHWLDVRPYRARLIALSESTDPFLRLAIAHALTSSPGAGSMVTVAQDN